MEWLAKAEGFATTERCYNKKRHGSRFFSTISTNGLDCASGPYDLILTDFRRIEGIANRV